MTDNTKGDTVIVEMASETVAAYVSNNPVPSGDLPGLIKEVHSALTGLGQAEEVADPPKPAVNPKRSVTDDYIICLEDGQKFKSLKRHLGKLGMTPDEYRQKWGLAADYPMVAPSYSKRRSNLAKEMGLGRRTANRNSNLTANLRVAATNHKV